MNYIINNKPILKYLKKNNMTQEQFAKECRVDISVIKNILNNKVDFKIKDIFNICDYLDCAFIEIFNLFKFLAENQNVHLKL